MKTYTAKPKEVQQRWYHIDATGLILGRLASEVANLLRGKYKPQFTPHIDVGDFVIITNAGKVRVTGRKLKQKMYYRHSGYPGGLKEIPLWRMMERNPERVIRLAVKRMLPKNKLGQDIYRKLKVYADADHPHEAQRPITLKFEDLLENPSPFIVRPEVAAKVEVEEKRKTKPKPRVKAEPEAEEKPEGKTKPKVEDREKKPEAKRETKPRTADKEKKPGAKKKTKPRAEDKKKPKAEKK